MKAIGQVSELADQPPLIALSVVTIMAGLLLGKGRLTRTGVRMLASHWLATQAKSFIKRRIDRTRPFVMLGGESYHPRRGQSRAKRENSFPSGHTAGAVAIARAVARDYPAAAPVGYAAATAAGAVQLPRGAHFLSDILVGAAIGLLAEAAADRRHRIRQEDRGSRRACRRPVAAVMFGISGRRSGYPAAAKRCL
jgi:membrane-associated phospholipid phosphatase